MRFIRLLLAGLAGGFLLSAPVWAAEATPAAPASSTAAAGSAADVKTAPPEVQFSGDVKMRPELQALAGVRAWRVNGEEIPLSAVQDRAMVTYGPSVLQEMVVERLLLQEVKRRGITVTDAEVAAKVKALREQNGIVPEEAFERWLQAHSITADAYRANARNYLYIERVLGSQVYVSDQEIEQWYNQMKDLYKVPASVSYRAMSFLTEQAAQAALADLRKGKSFQEVAKASAAPNDKALAGELATYQKGQSPAFTKEIEDALFQAPLNQVTAPIRVQGTFVLLRVEKKVDEHQFTLNELRDRIRDNIRQEKLGQVLWPAWVNAQLAAAEITPVK